MAHTNTDEAALALKTHGSAILRLAFAYLHNLSDAEDVLQDTLIRFMEKRPELESEEHKKAWLLRVAINQCKNRTRSAWARRQEIPETLSVPEPDEGEPEVLRAVASLPSKYLAVVHLFYFEQYTTAQIAEMLGKNESTVRSLLHRARKLLKEDLKGEYDQREE